MTNLFSKPQPAVVNIATPTPTPPPPMPDPFGPSAREAQRQAVAGAVGGRSSTILTTASSRARGTIAGAGAPTPGMAYASRSLGGS